MLNPLLVWLYQNSGPMGQSDVKASEMINSQKSKAVMLSLGLLFSKLYTG